MYFTCIHKVEGKPHLPLFHTAHKVRNYCICEGIVTHMITYFLFSGVFSLKQIENCRDSLICSLWPWKLQGRNDCSYFNRASLLLIWNIASFTKNWRVHKTLVNHNFTFPELLPFFYPLLFPKYKVQLGVW